MFLKYYQLKTSHGMKRHTLLALFALTTLIVGILHIQSIAHYWYWVFWWMDIVTHFLGGAVVAFGILWGLTFFRRYEKKLDLFGILWIVLLSVGIVGIGWEVFEAIAGLHLAENPLPDTIQDIFADIAGGLAAYVVYHKVVSL